MADFNVMKSYQLPLDGTVIRRRYQLQTAVIRHAGIKDRERFRRHFSVEPPVDLGKHDVWPGYVASFIRRHPQTEVGDEAAPALEALSGLFGLVPSWSPDTNVTYNACTETVVSKPSFMDAWKHAQHCIIPADTFFEPDWRSGGRYLPKLDG